MGRRRVSQSRLLRGVVQQTAVNSVQYSVRARRVFRGYERATEGKPPSVNVFILRQELLLPVRDSTCRIQTSLLVYTALGLGSGFAGLSE